MKIIGSVKEDLASEKRISITPETTKKLIDLKFNVFLEKDYGSHLGITEEEYKNQGATLLSSAKEVLENPDYIVNESYRIKDIVDQQKGYIGGEYRLGIIPTIMPTLLPLFLKNFVKKVN